MQPLTDIEFTVRDCAQIHEWIERYRYTLARRNAKIETGPIVARVGMVRITAEFRRTERTGKILGGFRLVALWPDGSQWDVAEIRSNAIYTLPQIALAITQTLQRCDEAKQRIAEDTDKRIAGITDTLKRWPK